MRPLGHELVVFPLVANEYGDGLDGTGTILAADVEVSYGWSHGDYADTNSGNATAWINPGHRLGRLVGLECEYGDSRFRIVGEQPSASLVTGEADLIELTLERLEATSV
jgi:hypothetical protein